MRRTSHTVLLAALLYLPAAAGAQAYPPFFPEPPAGVIEKMRSVQYATADTTSLLMDVYRPAKATRDAPVLILYILNFPERKPERETNEWIQSWARMAAANGIVAILPDLRAEPGTGNASGPARARGDDFDKLLTYVGAHAREYGADPERIAVFAGSGAVASALPAVEDPRQVAIRSAVMYYGGAGANVTSFRVDLPLLYVRSGLDSPGTNAEIVKMIAAATTQNAPITLVNHHIGEHGFEGRNNDLASKQIIEETVAFVQRTTDPAYQAAIRSRHLYAAAAGQISAADYAGAAQTFAKLLKQKPGDPGIRVSYGSALLSDKQYAAACEELRAIAPPQYSALLPGARACVLAQKNDLAIALLQSMPKDWLKFAEARLRADSVYAPIWERTDFKALFGN